MGDGDSGTGTGTTTGGGTKTGLGKENPPETSGSGDCGGEAKKAQAK